MEKDNTLCRLCEKVFEHLGSHIYHKHKMTAREYKEMFELDYNFPLISEAVKHKKQIAFEEDREKYIKNLLVSSKKYRFKKGFTNKQRISQQSLDRYLGNLEAINRNRGGQCPICKMRFDHVASHLYNKHGLVTAKK